MHSGGIDRAERETNGPITWDWILGQLTHELPDLVEDFLREFRATEPYPGDQVDQQDIADTAKHTFEVLIRRLRSEPDPPGTAGLIERLAARRAQQGVPLSTFLRAVRIDFRVMWLRVQRIAGEDGSAVLAANAMRLLDTVDGYVDALREAYRAEASRIDRTDAAQRQRMILRLFGETPLVADDIELVATRLRMRSDATFEVVAVMGEATAAMIARYGADRGVGISESASDLILFREQRATDGWRRDAPGIGGYVGDVQGLAGVPGAARVAREVARHAPRVPLVLATEEEVWPTVARAHLAGVFPRYTEAIDAALRTVSEHERGRLLEAVGSYLATGSVKETAERLFCHRNTVINRLRAFAELTGFDPTVPRDAAWITVALAPEPARAIMQSHKLPR
ncbi:helix-turn-helix domain-containing protein [Leucobacter luti]|uniref:PucR-like helix-turn-helix protein n=1 Tax=Leucobacter luti TaxID=340320 RepID=A0A4Q7U3D5_9MICO|nr:helix-turn-helix domain-containing protein [Leucobacter luti]MBL3699214.1 PucR family transcriptional regulator [Leucobacter luti]RZT66712.1 PucR-like helix-turn-helix protein [Leucobacter luti]